MNSEHWWRGAVLYQVYPRSFADSDGDGVGDIRGVITRLDHLAWLGVDGIWLSPVYPSPNVDWGYDVSDYCEVHPELGTLDDVDALVHEASNRDLKVVFDLVPNHTSEQHPWFLDARSSRDSAHRDWYVWADPGPDGGAPNNWVSTFMGPAWTLDDATGQYFLHNFLSAQPDLNWWNDEVRDAIDDVFRFWFDRGVAGFRIDVCHVVIKDRELHDNPPTDEHDHIRDQIRGQKQVFNADRPEVHDVLQRWRRVAQETSEERLLLGEVHLMDVERMVRYYGEADDELHLAFNFPFVYSPLDAETMRAEVDVLEASLPEHAWPCWTGSNHDAGRLATRWAQGDPGRTRCALMMLLTLRGTPVLYYGDEIGLEDVRLERDQLLDPVGKQFFPVYAGRDPGRTPMHWDPTPGAGFTIAGVEPWLPFGDLTCNVEDQHDDPDSVLHLCRDLIALRRESDDLRRGGYVPLEAPDGVWMYSRGDQTVVVLNLGSEEQVVPDVAGEVLVGTDRSRDGQAVTDSLALAAGEGVVLSAAAGGIGRRGA